MVGGRPPKPVTEELYSFIFPEKPGALTNFLAPLSERWNISLFHYRSHGADYGRVLIAFEVGEAELAEFEAQLKDVGYPFSRETSNPAYKLLLSGDTK
jgi:threonine dehydratase